MLCSTSAARWAGIFSKKSSRAIRRACAHSISRRRRKNRSDRREARSAFSRHACVPHHRREANRQGRRLGGTHHDAIGAVFPEERIFRIDHYLGKETVQNLMAAAVANALFEPLWNSAHINHVEITVAESIGVESVRLIMKTPARCATWCRIICCNFYVSSPWSRLPPWTRIRCATRNSRC